MLFVIVICGEVGYIIINQSINQSISLLATLRPESRIANDMQFAVKIIDKTAYETNNVHYVYIGAGRDVWSALGVTMLVGNDVGQSL